MKPETTLQIEIRPMSEGDLAQVLEIERKSFQAPWTPSHFLGELRRGPISRCFVAEIDQDALNPVPSSQFSVLPLAGFIMAWFVADEIHITNLAVAPDYRRCGLADSLISFLLDSCAKSGAKTCLLEVRVSNSAAISLYGRLGFIETGVRPSYYQDGEDALLLELVL